MDYVVIISANSDMATACARRYASQGYNLLLSTRQIDRCEILAADLRIRYPIQVQCQELDILDFQEHVSWVETAFETTQQRIAGVIVFCGYLGEQTLAQNDFNESKKIIDTNFIGVVSLLNIFANKFEVNAKGFIIAISSVAGERGRQSNYIYGAAKAALSAYLSGLRNRLHKKGIQVITVKPGFVNTKMTDDMNLPAALTAEAEDVASAIWQAQQSHRDIIYVKKIWWLIMFIIRALPEFIFKRSNL